MKSEILTEKIRNALKEDTRFAIYSYLTVHKKLTLKELSIFLNKGKTTIHHHMRILEDAGLVIWNEETSDKKKLKTRYYSLNFNVVQRIINPTQNLEELFELTIKEKIDLMKIEKLITNNFMQLMIDSTEALLQKSDLQSFFRKDAHFTKTFILTKETLPIYKEFEKKMAEAINSTDLKELENSSFTHVYTHVFIPIKKVLESRRKTNKE
ncbi:MAG: ArsR/SmtB family transcription factor [Candidatus Hodarchaeota archaeon]